MPSLPDAISLGPVRLQVADLGRSVNYYQDVLGFRLMDRRPGLAALGAAGGEAPLVLLEERTGAAPVPRRGRLGLYHFAVLLPERADLGRLVEHLAALGVRPGASDHRVSEALYLTDPDGLGIEVYTDRPRAEWEWRDGELVMSTDPLDLDGLARAGGGVPWDGMPAGTRIGHLHLHVGSLQEAERFYREGLGLEPTVRRYPGALFLSAGGYHHHLGVNTWAGPEARPPAAGDARLLEWSVIVPASADAEAAAHRVAAASHGARRDGAGWLLTDPWGTVLRLVTAGA